jgi:hypothetical protein
MTKFVVNSLLTWVGISNQFSNSLIFYIHLYTPPFDIENETFSVSLCKQSKRMEVLFYSHTFGRLARGLTNQVLFMLNHLIIAQQHYAIHKRQNVVVFLDHFYDHYQNERSKNSFSSIIDIPKLNETFFPNLHIIDLHALDQRTSLDLEMNTTIKSPVPLSLLPQLVALRTSVFDNGVKDPAFGIQKHFILNLVKNDSTVQIRMKEVFGRFSHVSWDNIPKQISNWGLDTTRPFIRSILKDISIRRDISIQDIPRPINDRYSIIHLRNENDALNWWCKGNRMPANYFDNVVTKKYIHLISQHIHKSDLLIILTGRTVNNPVIQQLEQMGYQVYINSRKALGKREVSALDDLVLSEKVCNSVLLCPTGGSTFSNWLAIRLEGRYQNLVTFDISRIHL